MQTIVDHAGTSEQRVSAKNCRENMGKKRPWPTPVELARKITGNIEFIGYLLGDYKEGTLPNVASDLFIPPSAIRIAIYKVRQYAQKAAQSTIAVMSY
jgi:hypothetical protein